MSDFFPPLPEDNPPSPPPAPPTQPPSSSHARSTEIFQESKPAPPIEAPPKAPSPPPPPPAADSTQLENVQKNAQTDESGVKEKKKPEEYSSDEEHDAAEGDGEGDGEPETFERVVLKGNSDNAQLYIASKFGFQTELNKHFHVILPSGWVEIRHFSGMNVYLHRESRVCTMSMPYHIGKESARVRK